MEHVLRNVMATMFLSFATFLLGLCYYFYESGDLSNLLIKLTIITFLFWFSLSIIINQKKFILGIVKLLKISA